uniref:Serpin domain-containing protein n=2 Tax=Setaria viridis TaxID=4556 RepID=A0A4U6VVR2_SETVI|nr:hypothetical protein SEVIR_2G276100v2 [Setaria viridis]
MGAAAAVAARRCDTSGLTALSHRLMKQLSATNRASNVVVSPLCIHSALSLLAYGARGSTLSEILGVVGASCRECLARDARAMALRVLPAAPDARVRPVAHDATRTLKPACRDAAWGCLDTEIGALDFLNRPEEAWWHINSRMKVSIKACTLPGSFMTRGSVSEGTRLVHTSLIHFGGDWRTPFSSSMNEVSNAAVDAEFMRSSQDQYVAEHDGFKVLRMPYTVPDPYHGILSSVRAQIVYTEAESWDVTPLPYPQFSLCIFLPDARDGLWSLEDKVLSEMGSIHEHLLLPRNRVGVGRFQVPKLKMCMSDGTSIKTVLQGLGIRALFSEEADMTNMLEHGGTGEPFFVNDVVHKAIFRVDEGDQSSEVTTTDSAARGGCLRLERQPVDFVADHPFAFFVVEEVTGAILLAGHVLDPTQVI